MYKILLIDDDEKIRESYKAQISEQGFEVVTASNAKDAIDLLLVKEFHVVLLDLSMPQIDGPEMMNIVKNYGLNFKFMTISALPVEEQELKMPDAEDYFDKSEDIKVLIHKIRAILKLE